MKGFFKGFKNMFAGKEHEIEIGFPTDVKHVSHIGWNSSSDHAPSWMKEFQTAAGYTSASLSNMGNLENNWLNRGILTEPESNRSLSEPFNSVNKSASTREDGRPCRKTRRKKKPKNPGSPSSSTSSSSTSRNKTHVKSKSTNFRSSCAAAMEDACAGTTNPYRTGCTREIT